MASVILSDQDDDIAIKALVRERLAGDTGERIPLDEVLRELFPAVGDDDHISSFDGTLADGLDEW